MANAYNFPIPSVWNPNGNASFGTFVLNETTDRIEFNFNPDQAMTISRVYANCSAVSGAPSVQFSLQGRNSSGRADGTIKGGGSAAVTWSPSVGSGWQTLATPYAATRSEPLCMVAQLLSGTSATFNVRFGSTGVGMFPCLTTFDNATVATTRWTAAPLFGYGTSSAAYGAPCRAVLQTTFTNAGTNEVGNVFTLPAWASTYRISGAWVVARLNAGSVFDLRLYAGAAANATTVTQSVTGIPAETVAVQNAYWAFFMPFSNATLATFNAGDSFRLALAPTTATGVGVQGYDFDVLADTDAWNPWNRTCFASTRAGGNWTDLNTRIWAIWPGFEDLTTSGGGGAGLLRHPAMFGGLSA